MQYVTLLSLALLGLGCSAHIQTTSFCAHGTIMDVRVGEWRCSGKPDLEYAGRAGQEEMSEQAAELAGEVTEALAAIAKLYGAVQGLPSILGGFPTQESAEEVLPLPPAEPLLTD